MARRNPLDVGEVKLAGSVSKGLYDQLQANLSDEDFLVAMDNRLLELEQEMAAPAVLRWIKRNLFRIAEGTTSLPGLDLKRLLRLAGQEVSDSLQDPVRYPVTCEQLSRLVEAAKAGRGS